MALKSKKNFNTNFHHPIVENTREEFVKERSQLRNAPETLNVTIMITERNKDKQNISQSGIYYAVFLCLVRKKKNRKYIWMNIFLFIYIILFEMVFLGGGSERIYIFGTFHGYRVV